MRKFFAAAVCAAVLATAGLAQEPASTPTTALAKPAQQPAIAPPAHPITLEQTRELFRLAGTQALIRQMAHQALGAQRVHAPEYIPAGVWDDLENSFNQVDFASVLTPVYQKYLSQEDAEKTIAFYKTAEGQRFLAAMPGILQGAAKTAQQQGARIGQEVFSRHQQEILDAKKKYDDERKQEQEQLAKPAAPGGKPEPVSPVSPH